MKHTFAKTIVLILALALTLSGCNLIKIDPKMQADEDIAKIDKKYASVVASYDGQSVTAADVMGDFNDNYNQMYYFYAYYLGTGLSEEDVHALIEETLETKVRSAVIGKHFDEAYTLTDEEIAEAEQTGETYFNELQTSALAEAEGKTDEEKQENARVLLATYGRSLESMKADAVLEAKVEKMEETLRDEVQAISDDELKGLFDERVQADEEAYTADPSSYGTDVTNGMTSYWVPDGYRTVKHILFIPETGTKSAYTDAVNALAAKESELALYQEELAAIADDDVEGARTAEEVQADIDAVTAEIPALESDVAKTKQACIDSVLPKVQEVQAKLAAGESFEDLMAEYGEDPGMQSEPAKTTGYYVCKESTNWHQEFTDAAMALAQVGDVSEPVVTASGVHIIEYASDVAGGPVAFETVKDALAEEELENRKDANRDDTIRAWLDAVNPVYDVAAFEAVLSAA